MLWDTFRDACLDKGGDGPRVFRFMACTMIAETILEVYVSIKGSYEFFGETSEFWKGDVRYDLGVEGGWVHIGRAMSNLLMEKSDEKLVRIHK